MNNENDENDQSKPYLNYDDTSNKHHKINPDCPICLKPVFWSRHILFLNRVWHLQCFICSNCFKSLRPGKQSYYRGKLFCTEPCFNDLFLSQYTRENLYLKDDSIGTDLIQNYARIENKTKIESDEIIQERKEQDKINLEPKIDCKNQLNDNNISKELKNNLKQTKYLHCSKCERLIINRNLYQTKKRNLDKKMTMNKSVKSSDFIGLECIRCMEKVYAAELCYSINSPLHFYCLKCSICERILQPAQHAVHDGLPICNFPCYNRIYLFGGYKKG